MTTVRAGMTAALCAALVITAAPLAAREDKAAEVLAEARKAIGAGKLDSMRAVSITAKTARNVGERQMTSEVELLLEMPDKYLRTENITAPIARTMSSGFNGDRLIQPAMGGPAGAPGAPMVVSAGGGGTMAFSGGGGGVRTMVMMGGDGAGRSGGTPAAEMTPEQRAQLEKTATRAQRNELSRQLLGWFAMAHPAINATYTYAGEAESPDGKAHIINVKADGNFDVNLFIDQATHLPLMVSYQGPEPRRFTATPGQTPEERQKAMEEMMKTPPKMIEYRVYFSDWKEVDGIQFPHLMQRGSGESTTEEWTIEKVKINPKIDAKKFEVK